MTDYIPKPDAQFTTWFTALVTYIQTHHAALGLTITESDALDALLNDPADGGKTAHYLFRWANTRGEPGPWSETISATIGA